MCHRAVWILFGYALKCLFRVGVGEGVKECDAAVELRLDNRGAGGGK
jgi:hypothetical protein